MCLEIGGLISQDVLLISINLMSLTLSWKWQKHHPVDWSFGKLRPCPMFLHPKPQWRQGHDVWFTIALVSRNQL